jgi:hypothetical protein
MGKEVVDIQFTTMESVNMTMAKKNRMRQISKRGHLAGLCEEVSQQVSSGTAGYSDGMLFE